MKTMNVAIDGPAGAGKNLSPALCFAWREEPYYYERRREAAEWMIL